MPHWLILLFSTLVLVVITELLTKQLETWLSRNNSPGEASTTDTASDSPADASQDIGGE